MPQLYHWNDPNRFRLTLTIDGGTYQVERLDVQAPYVRAYRLTKRTGEHYDCSQDAKGHTTCCCGDWTFRHKDGSLCKHLLALFQCGLMCEMSRCGYAVAQQQRHAILTEAARTALRAGLYSCDGCGVVPCACCLLVRTLAEQPLCLPLTEHDHVPPIVDTFATPEYHP